MEMFLAILMLLIMYLSLIFCIFQMKSKEKKKNRALEEAGLKKERPENFYDYDYYFLVNNADFDFVRDEFFRASEYKLVKCCVYAEQPLVIFISDNRKNPSWQACLRYVPSYSVFVFGFIHIRSVLGTVTLKTEMNTALSLAENILLEMDPDLILRVNLRRRT